MPGCSYATDVCVTKSQVKYQLNLDTCGQVVRLLLKYYASAPSLHLLTLPFHNELLHPPGVSIVREENPVTMVI